MATQAHADLLSALFNSPIVKGVLSAGAVFAAILRYILCAHTRLRQSARMASRYDFGRLFSIIATVPYRLHLVVAYGGLLAAIFELLLLLDQTYFASVITNALPSWLGTIAALLSKYFVGLFGVALLLYLAFELRLIERVLGWTIGWFPGLRLSLEWPNAMWQIESDSDDHPVLGLSEEAAERYANLIITTLTTSERSPNLALRPANLSDKSAANVLFFGHVVEEYCSKNSKLHFPWTKFYQAFANLAHTDAAPFAPATIRALPATDGFFATLLQANADMDGGEQIPNDAGLEAAVDDAFCKLRKDWRGDASTFVSGFLGTDYGRVLRKASRFLQDEGMRRQFAKLFILWSIKPGATHPAVFRIPFSPGVFLKYLDDGIILSEGSRFDIESERVPLCFEVIEQFIVKRVYELLEKTKDAGRVKWIEDERKDVATRKLDWAWWIYYRSDTQAYSDSSGYVSKKWETKGKEIVLAEQG